MTKPILQRGLSNVTNRKLIVKYSLDVFFTLPQCLQTNLSEVEVSMSHLRSTNLSIISRYPSKKGKSPRLSVPNLQDHKRSLDTMQGVLYMDKHHVSFERHPKGPKHILQLAFHFTHTLYGGGPWSCLSVEPISAEVDEPTKKQAKSLLGNF